MNKNLDKSRIAIQKNNKSKKNHQINLIPSETDFQAISQPIPQTNIYPIPQTIIQPISEPIIQPIVQPRVQPIIQTLSPSSNENQMMHFYATNARYYATFARLAYCPRNIIENVSCSFCSNLQMGNYIPYFIHRINENPNRVFQLVILYSDFKKEIIISFRGPSSEHGSFFTNIFLEGFIIIPEIGNLKVEKVYWNIYKLYFRDLLISKVQKFLSIGRADYKFIFVGHSFGGSIATLASYDLVYNRIIPKNPLMNSPHIFTYGQLRIGDLNYINKLNSEMKIIRILKKDDFIARMPNCVFINGEYECFETEKALIDIVPRMRSYIDSYGNIKKFFAFLESKSTNMKLLKKKISKKENKNKNKDPIIRGTTMISGNLIPTHKPIFYTQPLGTELLYTQKFDKIENCSYVDGVPLCEKNIFIPKTFNPEVHRTYYNMNIELC